LSKGPANAVVLSAVLIVLREEVLVPLLSTLSPLSYRALSGVGAVEVARVAIRVVRAAAKGRVPTGVVPAHAGRTKCAKRAWRPERPRAKTRWRGGGTWALAPRGTARRARCDLRVGEGGSVRRVVGCRRSC
jgi:hypothetical protein